MLRRGGSDRGFRPIGAGRAAAVLVVAAAGCEVKDSGDDAVAGKRAFVQSCGSCHVLSRAGTTGTTGPNLDAAFARAKFDGLGEDTIKGVVHQQIIDPARSSVMAQANLPEGETAKDIAEYVARVAAESGEDTGALAAAVPKASQESVAAENGRLEIPADPNGLLAYTAGAATAPPGMLTITSPNEAQIPHNIALEGGGVNEVGEVVERGGVSEIEVDVDAGEYTFYCSVPGHRAGGMEGTLTVE